MPPEVVTLVDRKYVVTVTPGNRSPHDDYHHNQVKKVELLQDLATRVLLPVGTSSTPQRDIQHSFEATLSNIHQGDLNATPLPVDSTTEKDRSPSSTAQKEMDNTDISFENKDKPKGDVPSELKSNKRRTTALSVSYALVATIFYLHSRHFFTIKQATKEFFPPENPKGQKNK